LSLSWMYIIPKMAAREMTIENVKERLKPRKR
jgi:hypothetical protein